MLWWNHTLSKCIRKGEEYHEKEKIVVVYLVYKSINFSYIKSRFEHGWGGLISIKR